jgi:hypothetical protein
MQLRCQSLRETAAKDALRSQDLRGNIQIMYMLCLAEFFYSMREMTNDRLSGVGRGSDSMVSERGDVDQNEGHLCHNPRIILP